MIVTPLYDRVILRVIDGDRTRGGLHIPIIAQSSSPMARAEVIAVGNGRPTPDGKLIPLILKVGDAVWYSRPAAQAIPYDDEATGSVVMLREQDVVAVVSDLSEAVENGRRQRGPHISVIEDAEESRSIDYLGGIVPGGPF
jgi:co-chaperonin GroES (HSP10)